MTTGYSRLNDIKFFSSKTQTASTGCAKTNCEDFCFVTPKGDVCDCRDGYNLAADLHSCQQDISWKSPR